MNLPPPTAEFFPTDHKARIVEHMNEDHADAVLRYARHHAALPAATAAQLADIDQYGIELSVTLPEGRRSARIAFAKPLEKPDDAHLTLVAMAKAARLALGAPSAEDEKHDAALARAREVTAKFRTDFKTVLLGTASAEGEPDASVAPAVLDASGAFLIYVSTLSPHTRNLFDTRRASVLLIEDEASAQHLLARKRLTFRCVVNHVPRSDAAFTAAMPAFHAKFGSVMEHLAKMTDFQLMRLLPQKGRLVAGFGQAYEVDPLDWSKLSHVGGSGQGHGHTEEKKA